MDHRLKEEEKGETPNDGFVYNGVRVEPETVSVGDRITHTTYVTGGCIMTVISNTPSNRR